MTRKKNLDPENNNEKLIDDVEAREILKVCRRTLYNYRKLGLKSYPINKKRYYFLTEVYAFIRTMGGPQHD